MAWGIPKPIATAQAHVRNGSTNAPTMSAAAMSAHIHTHQRAHSDGLSLPHTTSFLLTYTNTGVEGEYRNSLSSPRLCGRRYPPTINCSTATTALLSASLGGAARGGGEGAAPRAPPHPPARGAPPPPPLRFCGPPPRGSWGVPPLPALFSNSGGRPP